MKLEEDRILGPSVVFNNIKEPRANIEQIFFTNTC